MQKKIGYKGDSIAREGIISNTLPHKWILTFGMAQCSNYDRELYAMKSDNLRLISEILDNLGPNWTKQTKSYKAQY